ncbi:MAG: DUF2061 domain-containing protein [Sulfitobacter sp.]
MDQRKRTLAKAMTWQTMGFVMMVVLGYLTTGSFTAAGGLAIATFVVGTISYVLHERVWAKIRWGVMDADQR